MFLSSYTGIIHFYFYKIKGKEIYQMFNDKGRFYQDDIHNLYTLNEYKHITCVDYYFQFIEEDSEKEYIIFSFDCADNLLREELSQGCSIEDYKFSLNFDNEEININEWNSKEIPVPTLVKMTVEYYKNYIHDCNCYEYDSEFYLELLKRKNNDTIK